MMRKKLKNHEKVFKTINLRNLQNQTNHQAKVVIMQYIVIKRKMNINLQILRLTSKSKKQQKTWK